MTPKQWQKNEIDCANYFKNKFSNCTTDITLMGDADSTVPDIKVETHNNKIIWIEIKSKKAQCGQFVLLPKGTKFEFSKKNKSTLCASAQLIIRKMNQNFRKFKNAGTKGEEIGLKEYYYFKWIKEYYSNKGVRLFITKSNDDYIILPLNKLDKYFNATGVYRVKKSGSANVPKKEQAPLISYMISNKILDPKTSISIGKELIIPKCSVIQNKKFTFADNEYIFTDIENFYKLKKLSKTNHANVIFSIVLKDGVKTISDEQIINILNE